MEQEQIFKGKCIVALPERKIKVKKKIYLAGAITGVTNYKEIFGEYAEKVEKSGDYVALNPAILPPGLAEADYMNISLAMMNAADTVLFLPGWEKSTGARVENELCRKIRKKYAFIGM